MDLLRNIRNDRAQLRRRPPLERKAFNTVSCIVKGYGLDENFLRLLDQTKDLPARETMEFRRTKAKKMLETPPFCLLSQQEYSIAVTIVGKLDNPYLPFAHSPEELLWCAPLYDANPFLDAERLLHHHFETLLECEWAKEELAQLERREGNFDGTIVQGNGAAEPNAEPSPRGSLQDRIGQLRTFLASIDNTES